MNSCSYQSLLKRFDEARSLSIDLKCHDFYRRNCKYYNLYCFMSCHSSKVFHDVKPPNRTIMSMLSQLKLKISFTNLKIFIVSILLYTSRDNPKIQVNTKLKSIVKVVVDAPLRKEFIKTGIRALSFDILQLSIFS